MNHLIAAQAKTIRRITNEISEPIPIEARQSGVCTNPKKAVSVLEETTNRIID
jgi:hypothetical protein